MKENSLRPGCALGTQGEAPLFVSRLCKVLLLPGLAQVQLLAVTCFPGRCTAALAYPQCRGHPLISRYFPSRADGSQQPPACEQKPVPVGWAPRPQQDCTNARPEKGQAGRVGPVAQLWVGAVCDNAVSVVQLPVTTSCPEQGLKAPLWIRRVLPLLVWFKCYAIRLALLLQCTSFPVLTDKPLSARSCPSETHRITCQKATRAQIISEFKGLLCLITTLTWVGDSKCPSWLEQGKAATLEK